MTERKDERKPPGPPKHPATAQERQQIVTGAAAGLSENRIAKQIGRSRKLVHDVIQKPETQLAITDERAELAELYKEKARKIVDSISPEDIAKSSLQQKAVSSGILLDKSLLLAGEPTQNVAVLVELAAAVRAQRRTQHLKELSAPPVIESAPPAKDSRQLASQDEPAVRYYPVPLKAPGENE